jgi:serine/threonine protein kinase
VVTRHKFIIYVKQLLETLVALHRMGIVHNDIKIPNCLFNANLQEATLIDFRLAKCHVPGSVMYFLNVYSPPKTETGTINHKVDIFNLGVVFA